MSKDKDPKDAEGGTRNNSELLKEAQDRAARVDELERRIRADSAKLNEKRKELKRLSGTLVEDLLNPNQGRLPLEAAEDATGPRLSLKDQAAKMAAGGGAPAGAQVGTGKAEKPAKAPKAPKAPKAKAAAKPLPAKLGDGPK